MRELDSDKDGRITVDEFIEGAIRLGLFLPNESAAQEQEQAAGAAGSMEDRSKIIANALAMFDSIDTDRGGTLDRSEVACMLRELGGGGVSEQQLQRHLSSLMTILDEDGDGTVTRNEFMSAVEAGHLDDLISIDDTVLLGRSDTHSGYSAQQKEMIQDRDRRRALPERVDGVAHLSGMEEHVLRLYV